LSATPERLAAERLGYAVPGLVAVVLGAFLILGAGFAPIQAIHNAAHDMRTEPAVRRARSKDGSGARP
jgi:cobalt transporter subunit CbtB